MSGPKKQSFWRNFSLLVVTAVGMVTILPLWNWYTGKQSLNTILSELRERGEPTTFAEVIKPERDPEATTFGNHPLIQELFAFPQDDETKELPEDLTQIKAMCEKGKISGDGVELPSLEAIVAGMELEAGDDGPLAALEEWSLELDPLIQPYLDLLELPAGAVPDYYNVEDPYETKSAHFSIMMSLTRASALRATLAMHQGDSARALAELKLAFRLAEFLESDVSLLALMVRVTILHITMGRIRDGMILQVWKEAELIELARELQMPEMGDELIEAMQSEALSFVGTMEDLTAKAQAEGKSGLSWPGMINHNCANKLRSMDEYIVDRLKERDWRAMEDDPHPPQLDEEQPFPNINWVLVRVSTPTYRIAIENSMYLESRVVCARAAIALERYFLQTGSYPDTLAEVDGEFLDPISLKPLSYRREGERYLLYGWGWDQSDGGGVIVRRDDGKISKHEGDVVWRYPDLSSSGISGR